MRFAVAAMISLLASVASGEPILMVVGGNVFWICEVTDGIPGEWRQIEKVIFSDENSPVAPKDEIATQVDQWTNSVNDPANRPRWAAVWNKVISDVESGKIDFEEAEQHITVGQTEIIEELDAAYRAAWTVWNAKVSNLIDDEKRQGRYTVTTLVSIHRGLVGF